MTWTGFAIARTVESAKITLDLDDRLLDRLRAEAARSGRTISDLVEAAARLLLSGPQRKPRDLPSLPTFNSGGHLVDISNRESSTTPWTAADGARRDE